WDTGPGKPTAALPGHRRAVSSIAFSPDGRTLAAGTRDAADLDKPGEVILWDLSTRRVRTILRGHDSGVLSVAFSPDGRPVASSGNRAIFFWNVADGRERRRINAPSVGTIFRVGFSPDGTTLAAAGGLRRIGLFDVATGRQRGDLLQGHTASLRCVVFSPDG